METQINLSFFTTLLNSVAEGIVVVNERGEIVQVNNRILSLFGYSKEEVLGNRIDLFLPKSIKKDHHKHVSGYFQNASPRLMSERPNLFGERKDGSQFPVEVSLNAFSYEGKKYAIGLVTDVTVRKAAEEEIFNLNQRLAERVESKSKDLLRTQEIIGQIARNFPEGSVRIVNSDFDILMDSDGQFSTEPTSRKPLLNNFSQRISDILKTNIQEALKKGGHSFAYEQDGNHFDVDCILLKEETFGDDAILLIQKEVTEKIQAEEETRAALIKERELNSMKSRFVSMASHEFRTPLAAILSSVSLIAKYQTTEQQENRNKHIGRIKSSVQVLTGILNDFLSLDKLETGKVEVNRMEFNVVQRIGQIVEDLENLGNDDQSIHFEHQGEEFFNIDKNLFNNILMNLISNGLKYSEKDINIMSSGDSAGLTINVQDFGIGIPEEEQKHLFERFFRAKNAINHQGTGLGLNITKKYIELLQGDIQVTSKSGEGTTFTVRIPTIK